MELYKLAAWHIIRISIVKYAYIHTQAFYTQPHTMITHRHLHACTHPHTHTHTHLPRHTCMQTRLTTPTPPLPTHPNTHTHTHNLSPTHTHTHTHTHSKLSQVIQGNHSKLMLIIYIIYIYKLLDTLTLSFVSGVTVLIRCQTGAAGAFHHNFTSIPQLGFGPLSMYYHWQELPQVSFLSRQTSRLSILFISFFFHQIYSV